MPTRRRGRPSTAISQEEPEDPNNLVHNEAEGVFLVERICGKRGQGSNLQYLVKWLGFPESEKTWEPFSSIAHCEIHIRAFEQHEKEQKLGRKGSRPGRTLQRTKKRRGRKSTSGTGKKSVSSRLETQVAKVHEYWTVGKPQELLVSQVAEVPEQNDEKNAALVIEVLHGYKLVDFGMIPKTDTTDIGMAKLAELTRIALHVVRIAGLTFIIGDSSPEVGACLHVKYSSGEETFVEFPILLVRQVLPEMLKDFCKTYLSIATGR